MAYISDATVAHVDRIAAEAERLETPCGDGTMVWRRWGNGGPPLVLLHGGLRLVDRTGCATSSRCRGRYTVFACDLPGLGESATPPEPWTRATGSPRSSSQGIDIVLPAGARAAFGRAFRLAA